MALLQAEAADSAAVVSVVAAVASAAAAAVNHPRLMEHHRMEAAGLHRPRMERLPVVAEVSAAAVSEVAVSEVGHLPRATERLLRPTARLPRAMGHRAAAVAAEVDTLVVEVGVEVNPRPAMERPVPAAAVALEAADSEEVDTPVAVVEYLQLTVHPREVAADIPEVAADTLEAAADIPGVVVADTLVAVVAADILAVVVADILAVVVADFPAVAVSEGKM